MIGSRTSILIISSVGYRHSGEFTCNARNAAGIDAASTALKVNGDYIKTKGGGHRRVEECTGV